MSVRLASDVHIKIGPWTTEEPGFSHMIDSIPKVSESSRGHYGHCLSRAALDFADQYAARLKHYSMRESFNRVSNALRLYGSALDLMPSDVALVLFVSVLEGIFSTATQELSYRIALSVSWFLASTADKRLSVFKEVKELYAVRSNVVHGDRINANEERAAILLAEDYVPRAEGIVRRAMRKILEEQLDGFIETTKHLDEFYQLLALGVPPQDALKIVGGSRQSSQRNRASIK